MPCCRPHGCTIRFIPTRPRVGPCTRKLDSSGRIASHRLCAAASLTVGPGFAVVVGLAVAVVSDVGVPVWAVWPGAPDEPQALSVPATARAAASTRGRRVDQGADGLEYLRSSAKLGADSARG